MKSFALLLGLALVVAVGACKPNEFVCTRNVECTGTGGGTGACVLDRCAYVDSACPSGWRWDDTAGDMADDCVPADLLVPDAGLPDAGLPDAAPTTIDAGAPDAGPVDAGAPDA
jgi:hypothetical protein